MTGDLEVEQLLREYHATLGAMHAERVETGRQPKRWNQLVDHLQALHLRLRESSAGRAGISFLIADENVTTRQWSATFALAWDPELARAELERQAEDAVGLTAFDAEMTLQEFDAGRLDLTWRPGGRQMGR